ncbi:metal-dependent transcriptional regulator [Amycolatopsis sp. NPDC059027]|uniref:metal-dependent transcriptional regulator n=1 Tax=Amycolatopsis sp. NPDC059027 TaxID=3346709 RepID=UPI00366BD402
MTAEGLIDTTEMYLKAAYELEEDGVVPLRARIADRLGQSPPTVSQTVSRLERDGLLELDDDRHLVLSERGRRRAVRVMRKHRLAEVLLERVIGLDWATVHVEACRWEHVMSEEAERRIFDLCGKPRYSPYGAPIPGLAEFDAAVEPARVPGGVRALSEAVPGGRARLYRISERIQEDIAFLRALRDAGIVPGAELEFAPDAHRVEVRTETGTLSLDRRQAAMLLVGDSTGDRAPAGLPGWLASSR